VNPRLPCEERCPFARDTHVVARGPARKGEFGESRAARFGAGFRRPAVVLADRFGCRSRRAARGRVRPGVKNAPEAAGSSPHSFGSLGAKERRKPDRGGEASGSVAGLRSRSSRESAVAEQALVEGRRPGPSGTVAFDEAAGKPVLAARRELRLQVRRDGGVSGRHARPVRGRQRRARGAPPVSPLFDRGLGRIGWRPRPPDRRGA
jgi:hypothetical protein